MTVSGLTFDAAYARLLIFETFYMAKRHWLLLVTLAYIYELPTFILFSGAVSDLLRFLFAYAPIAVSPLFRALLLIWMTFICIRVVRAAAETGGMELRRTRFVAALLYALVVFWEILPLVRDLLFGAFPALLNDPAIRYLIRPPIPVLLVMGFISILLLPLFVGNSLGHRASLAEARYMTRNGLLTVIAAALVCVGPFWWLDAYLVNWMGGKAMMFLHFTTEGGPFQLILATISFVLAPLNTSPEFMTLLFGVVLWKNAFGNGITGDRIWTGTS